MQSPIFFFTFSASHATWWGARAPGVAVGAAM